jgi:hypothetical protein
MSRPPLGGARPAGPPPTRAPSPDRAESGLRPGGRTLPVHWVLLAALLAGVVLGCLLAGLSVLDPGLLPALG